MEVFIVDAVRTPFGKRGGALSKIHPVDLAAMVLIEIQERNGFDPTELGMIQLGCSTIIGEQSLNVARNAVLAAGWSEGISALTIDSIVSSGHMSIHLTSALIRAGMADICIAGGVDSPSRIPPGASYGPGIGKPFGPGVDQRYAKFGGLQPSGMVAENLAKQARLRRKALDAYGIKSRERFETAWRDGVYKNQIVREIGLDQDELLDEAPNFLDLKPTFTEDGVITGATFPQAVDGSAALLLASADWCERRGLTPLARIVHSETAGLAVMKGGSWPAVEKIAEQFSPNRIDVFEDSAVTPTLIGKQLRVVDDIVNPDGGCIGSGNALAASSASLVVGSAHSVNGLSIHNTLAISAGTLGVGIATVLGKP